MTQSMITNPILPGFHPDPSIVRAGDDYYIANSTFEWFPGVRIHHSRDLIHWRLAGYALTRRSHLDMRGNPDSGGIWAPCLSYHNGTFYLVYTDVKVRTGAFKDTPNYLSTAKHIEGPWSDPVYCNASGFDPSLFHDDDGRKWLVNMVWDFRAGRNSFAGIVLREYSEREKRLVGPVFDIFDGTSLGVTEGPHLYKRHGYYYLMTAEGGTGYNHAVTMARSRTITGPYEVDPENPILTSRAGDAALHKAGHGSLVETPDGETYLAHLCARPVGAARRCVLGRETAIQKCRWTEDGWLRLASGASTPAAATPAPRLPAHPFDECAACEQFETATLPPQFQTLRRPFDASWGSLSARPGWLRLYGGMSTVSRHGQSLVARRIVSTRCVCSTCVDFAPVTFQHMAGLIAFYDVATHYYACITRDERRGRCLRLLALDTGAYSEPVQEGVSLPEAGLVFLRATFRDETLRFFWSLDNERWSALGPELDATRLSDDYCGGFTGAFVGMCCQDLRDHRVHADFDWFAYTNTR
jgi:xylan 1,4-beta-xylosidase